MKSLMKCRFVLGAVAVGLSLVALDVGTASAGALGAQITTGDPTCTEFQASTSSSLSELAYSAKGGVTGCSWSRSGAATSGCAD